MRIPSIRTSCCSGSIRAAVLEDIRIDHAKQITEMDLDGYAVGGLAVGESHEEMYRILDVTVPHLAGEQTDLPYGCGNTCKHSGSGGARCGFL